MKTIKKVLLIFIFTFSLLTLFACVKDKYTLEANLKDELYEFETIEVEVELLSENEESITEFDYSINSSDETVISIIDKVLSAKKAGKVTITISATYNKKSYELTKEVNVKTATLEVNIPSSIWLEEEVSLKATLLPSNIEINNFTFTSEQDNVVFGEDNKILAVKIGTSNIVFKAIYEGNEYSISKTIEVKDGFNEVIYNGPKSIVLGTETVLDFVMKPALFSPKNFSVSSSNVYVLAVNKDFSVKALSVGTAVITISYDNGEQVISNNVELSVIDKDYPTEEIVLSGSSEVYVGNYITISALIIPSVSIDKVLWSSSDTAIAKVNAKGNVTGISPGTVTITATSQKDSKQIANYIINVVPKSTITNVAGAKYYVDEVTQKNVLPYDVVHHTYSAYSSTPTSGIDVDGYSGVEGTIVPNKFYHQQVNVLEVPSSEDIQVVSWANWTDNVWSLTTVKGLIFNYESNNPGWKVIAAVNGDFFDINGNGNLPYQTTGSVVCQGEYYKTISRDGYALGFTNNGTENSLIGNHNLERTAHMILAIYDEEGKVIKELPVENLNTIPGENQTSVYFGVYNENKEYVAVNPEFTDNGYVVQKAELALPNSENDFYGKGTITSRTNQELGIGSFAIVTNNQEVKDSLAEGLRIRVQYEYVGDYENCLSMTGCRVTLLKDGEYAGASVEFRAPRTVVGKRADGTIVMMVIDGRQGSKDMYGADELEMATIMKANGCVEAYNLDGGGSSTMVIRTTDGLKILNSPSDGRERSDGNCILIVVKEPIINTSVSNIAKSTATINVSLEDNSGKDVRELYVNINNEMLKVTDGYVDVTNLIHNNTYSYNVFYKKTNGDMVKTLTMGQFSTEKNSPELLGIILEETDDAFKFTAKFIDNDNASMLKMYKVDLNGLYTFASNGVVTLKKEKVGEKIENLKFTYTYILLNQVYEVVLDDYECYYIDSTTK